MYSIYHYGCLAPFHVATMPPLLMQQNNDPQFFTPVQRALLIGERRKTNVSRRGQLDFPQSDRWNYNPGAESVLEGYNSRELMINLSDKCEKRVNKPSLSFNLETISAIYQEEDLEEFEKKIASKKHLYSPQFEKSDCESIISNFSAFKIVEE